MHIWHRSKIIRPDFPHVNQDEMNTKNIQSLENKLMKCNPKVSNGMLLFSYSYSYYSPFECFRVLFSRVPIWVFLVQRGSSIQVAFLDVQWITWELCNEPTWIPQELFYACNVSDGGGWRWRYLTLHREREDVSQAWPLQHVMQKSVQQRQDTDQCTSAIQSTIHSSSLEAYGTQSNESESVKCRFSVELKNWKKKNSRWGASSKNKSEKPWASIFTLHRAGIDAALVRAHFLFAGAPTIENQIEQ